jgi:hypothetical protein
MRSFHSRAFGTLAIAGLALSLPAGTASAQSSDEFSELASSITLKGTVRDFLGRDLSGGHDDFEWQPKDSRSRGSYGHYMDMVADELDDDGKPVFRSQGRKVTSQWTDSGGNEICPPKSYLASRTGDRSGSAEASGLSVHDAEGVRPVVPRCARRQCEQGARDHLPA